MRSVKLTLGSLVFIACLVGQSLAFADSRASENVELSCVQNPDFSKGVITVQVDPIAERVWFVIDPNDGPTEYYEFNNLQFKKLKGKRNYKFTGTFTLKNPDGSAWPITWTGLTFERRVSWRKNETVLVFAPEGEDIDRYVHFPCDILK